MSATISQRTKIKILVVGSPRCGKTTFIQRVVTGNFVIDLKSTRGVENQQKELVWDRDHCVLLDFWDIGGQDEYTPMMRYYIKDADGALLFFDLSRPETFKSMEIWLKAMDDMTELHRRRPLPVVLVGNKQDIQQQNCDTFYPRALWRYCDGKGLVGYQLTSVKHNYNVDQAVNMIVEQCLKERANRSRATSVTEPQDTIRLGLGQSFVDLTDNRYSASHRNGERVSDNRSRNRQRPRWKCSLL